MPDNDLPSSHSDLQPSKTGQNSLPVQGRFGIFSIPLPVKRVFDTFPLVTYAANELPARAPTDRNRHDLYVFTTLEDARRQRPSFNPGCLKWQAYLSFVGVPFRTVASSNHASPSGVLPFLLPAEHTSDPASSADPVPSSRLNKWVAIQKNEEKSSEVADLRYDAYASLLDTRIRKAWLYQLYLTPLNASVVHKLYVAPCSSNFFVQMTIVQHLHHATETELIKASASDTLVEDDIMHEAESAFEALSTLLGEGQWFFGSEKPGLLDAGLFAYTHLILDENLEWQDNKLVRILRRSENLVRHRKQVLKQYFQGPA